LLQADRNLIVVAIHHVRIAGGQLLACGSGRQNRQQASDVYRTMEHPQRQRREGQI
jgi:hypothetical protein